MKILIKAINIKLFRNINRNIENAGNKFYINLCINNKTCNIYYVGGD